jgi:hypothetical protein
MPNPLGDLERSLDGLNEELEALRILPEIRDQLVEVNANLRAMCDALAGLELPAATPAEATPATRRKRAA